MASSEYGITLEKAQRCLEQALEAREAILTGQRYKLGSRELQRADLEAVEKDIQYWQSWVTKLSPRKRRRVWQAIPRDL